MPTEVPCYTDEWQRTRPELVIYLPRAATGPDAENQHFLAMSTPRGTWIATWTQASVENHPDQCVVVSRSTDRGRTWSAPVRLDGQRNGDGRRASWGWPFVVPETGRVYVFYNKNIGITDAREDTTGVLRCRYSDDDGLTWSAQTHDLPIAHAAIDHPDPAQPRNWIVYQKPTVTSWGDVIAGFTRWSSRAYNPERDLFKTDAEVFFLRFDNILTERDPAKLQVTTLPRAAHGIRVPRLDMPSVSVAQEPTVCELSDGRLICVMRTLNGMVYHSLSSDRGETWTQARPLCYAPGGQPVLNPIAPCPLYRLRDGRYLLVFYNNDGTANGGTGPGDYKRNRYPAYITVGREVPGEWEQPLRFGPPRLFATSDGVPAGPIGRTEVATYCSVLEDGPDRYLFYPDRKHFLLARRVTDEWLAEGE
jgi:hypothetical protein